MKDSEERLSMVQAAKYCGITRQAIFDQIKNGKLKSHIDKSGKRYLLKSEIDQRRSEFLPQKKKHSALDRLTHLIRRNPGISREPLLMGLWDHKVSAKKLDELLKQIPVRSVTTKGRGLPKVQYWLKESLD